MGDTPLDYDRQIWITFSVGVTSSVIILYYSIFKITDEFYQLMALILGFSVLIYSIFLTLGYGFKKKKLINVTEDREIERLREDLSNRNYSRTRWMGEAILGFIAVIYFITFCEIGGLIYFCISLSIAIFFLILCVLANLSRK